MCGGGGGVNLLCVLVPLNYSLFYMDSFVGKVSDRKSKRNIDPGSIPRCDKGFFSQSQLSVLTLTTFLRPRCPSFRMHEHVCAR